MAPPGPRLTDALQVLLDKVVARAHEGGFTVSSDFARSQADAVAIAACLGLITTQTQAGFGRTWRPTSRGLGFFYEWKLS